MRTYSRKRSEIMELENVMDVCRLCLEKPDEHIPIYSENSKSFSSLALRIMVCVGLEVTKEDCISNIICTQCHKEIENIYTFRKKCAVSYQKLKAHIQAVKEKEIRENQNNVNMFTINPDGSIVLRHGNNGILDGGASDEPLVIPKILSDENKLSNTEALNNENKVDVTENTMDSNQLLDEEQQTTQVPSLEVLTSGSKEHLIPEEKVPPDPEISEFLSTMLTELGILTRYGDGSVDLDPKTSRTLKLETRDGNNITFELVEEDDELENNSGERPAEGVINNKEVAVQSLPRVRVRAGRRGAKCAQCGKVLVNSAVLSRHVRNVHMRYRPFACARCGKTFAQKEVLGRHLLVHQENRPFQCSKCPKSFTQRGALETHTRLHTLPQDRSLTLHQCPQCPKMFLYQSGLSRHLQSHISNTQYQCGECGRRLADKSSLRRHERTMRHYTNHDNGKKEDGNDKEGDKNGVVSTNTIDKTPTSTSDTGG